MMTEKELLHKRERKAKRRIARKKELAKDPEKMAAKEAAHLESIIEGEVLLRELYEPLIQAEEIRKEVEEKV